MATMTGLPDQGKGLELSERMPRAMRADSGLDDVFAMVKERMASDTLSQPPLLVLPGNLLQQSKNMLNLANSSECPLETCHIERERLDELRMLRHAIGIDFPHLSRALGFYDAMIEGRACSGHVPQLSFLRRASTDGRRDWGAVRLGQRPRTPKPHELQVVFHRARV